MALANTSDSYGSVTRVFHWLTALLILTAMPLGLIAYNMPEGSDAEITRKALAFSIHKTVGVAAFFVALARILWALTQTKPNPVHADRKGETVLAETVHWVLYVSLVIVPLSGWLHHAALSGFAPILWPFGQTLPFVPQDPAVADFFGAWHWLFTKVLGAAIFLHIAGALKHAFIDKDGVLARMSVGRPAGPIEGHHARSPLLYASVLWAATIAAGSALALVGEEERDVAALAEVASDWTVEDGTLAIEVLQLGNPASGGFEDWTAAITFDENAQGEQKGTAEVTVAIGSLALSGVVDQALSPDFF
ncbi:MAG: cytochrome b, partial [Pseudomonadota bacterium]